MMTNEAEIGADATSEPHAYHCTFGVYNQTKWTDVRTLRWSQTAALLTTHEIGAKEGTCIVPAVFRGTRRHKADADRIDIVFLDSDSGYTLEEIKNAVSSHGWSAIISSTHSHLTTRTRVRRGNWDKFRAEHGDKPDLAVRFLEAKGYQSRVVIGSRVADQTDEYVFLEHQPCSKFRIAIPLLRPWMASAYNAQREANGAWKERIEALAAALRLNHDQACTDTSRVFYLPRRPAEGPAPETTVLTGEPCDIFELPSAPKPEHSGSPGRRNPRPTSDSGNNQVLRSPGGRDVESLPFADSETGEVVDLVRWSRANARRFEIATALKARHPSAFVGKVIDNKHHIRCVNAAAHTQAGDDTATFVMNASESEKGWFIHHCRHAHCDDRDRLLFVRQMLEQGWLKVADLTDTRFLTGTAPNRPLIRFVGGGLPEVMDQVEQALQRSDLGLYQRGSFLVRPGVVMVNVPKRGIVTARRILEVEDHAMAEIMTQAADWKRFDARSQQWVSIDAPIKVATTYRQRVGHWKLPVLAGIINAPTLRPDGSILATPGYDPETGLLLDIGGTRFPTVREQPTKDHASRALKVLEDLVGTFPFVDFPSRSVALSAILTSCIRRSLPTAPLHGFTAPTAGSGKSMLVDLASMIATGREAGVITQGKTEEELEKRLGALLLAGDLFIAIDNCEVPLAGEFLCAMLTQSVVRPRILGRSEAPELPANAFVTATGNNLVLSGDLTRRNVTCRLDPKCERPELRQFVTNPITMVKAGRTRYVAAALTILRAYHVAGRPEQPEPLGSFEEWSGWVRASLMWLGQADPVDTMENARAMDPKLAALVGVLVQWHSVIGDISVSAREVIERANAMRTVPADDPEGPPQPEYAHPDFRNVLLGICGDGGELNSKRLGKWLGLHQDRIAKGLRVERSGLSGGILRWRVQPAGTASDVDRKLVGLVGL